MTTAYTALTDGAASGLRQCSTYEFLCERCLVVLRQMFLESKNNAVGDDCQQHHVLERRTHAVKDRLHYIP